MTKKILVVVTIIVVVMLFLSYTGILGIIKTGFENSISQGSTKNVKHNTMENVTMNVIYDGSQYSVLFEVNKSSYNQLPSNINRANEYVYLNLTQKDSQSYRIYRTNVAYISGPNSYSGTGKTLKSLLFLWIVNQRDPLPIQNMTYINSVFSAAYNASGYWSEAAQWLELGAGWVFNHIDFVSQVINEIEKLLTPTPTIVQAENFVSFENTLLQGSNAIKSAYSNSEFNNITMVLRNYNIVDSSTYGEFNVFSGISHLQNITLQNLTTSLFQTLYGGSSLTGAIGIASSSLQNLVTDSNSIGLEAGLKVAGYMAEQYSFHKAFSLMESDVIGSFLSIDMPLAILTAFSEFIGKVIQEPLNYIGIEYHIEKTVFQNLSTKFSPYVGNYSEKGLPDLSNLQLAGNYYASIVSLITIWYMVNLHLNSGSSYIVAHDTSKVRMGSNMLSVLQSNVQKSL